VFRLLSRYVFREIITSAVLGTLLATFVLFMQSGSKLFDLLVQSSAASAKTVGLLFLYTIPQVLPLTIPFGVLVGILIGLGRMGADGEIVAMRANGVSSRRLAPPVLAFAFLGMCLAGYCSLRLTPLTMRESTKLVNDLLKSQLSADIPPRVFDDDFPNTILYVGEVTPGNPGDPVRWHPVFMANVTPPEQRKVGLKDKALGPMIMVAREAIAVTDLKNRRIQLSMRDMNRYEMGKDAEAHDETAVHWDMALAAAPAKEKAPTSKAKNTRELAAYKSGPDYIENKIELHRRLALPVACVMLALVGIPLGAATRRGGKSSGYVNAVVLAFFGYWVSFGTFVKLAQQQKLPIPVAVWLPDAIFGLAGVILIVRMERPGDNDAWIRLRAWSGRRFAFLKVLGARPAAARLTPRRIPLLPQLLDTYILSRFLFYFAVLLTSFVLLFLIFNFFDLTGDMVRNKIPLSTMLAYLFFLTPETIYQFLPISVLVAVLVAFGVLSKQNEITAFKACGVSIYRMVLPIFLGSTLLAGGLFAFDHYYVPDANRRQDALRAEIKGAPPQTYAAPERKWIMGNDHRIYYYRYFDQPTATMGGVNVFELDSHTFQMRRQIAADRAHWLSSAKQWVFEKGWYSDFHTGDRTYQPFDVKSFPELTEPPDYFLKEALLYTQMNFLELDRYIRDLRQSGFDTVKLQVQFQRKFAVPLFALIMALIAAPFGFMVGNRGAMTGVGVSIGIAMAYWGVSALFEKAGGASQLQPAMAAWSPDVMFALAGLYLLLRARS
jgi:LPS export ABC transporter permease LptG/LPS export ABC transporter permease LptF